MRDQDAMDSIHEPQGKLQHMKQRVHSHNHQTTSLRSSKRGSDGRKTTDLVATDFRASFVSPFLNQHPCDKAEECLPSNDGQDSVEERDAFFHSAPTYSTAGHSSTPDQDYQPLNLCTKKAPASSGRCDDSTRDNTHSFRKPQVSSIGRLSHSDHEVRQVDSPGQSISQKRRGRPKSLLASGHSMTGVTGPLNNLSHMVSRSTNETANIAAALALLQQQRGQQQHHQPTLPALSLPNSQRNKLKKHEPSPLMRPPANIDVSSGKLSMDAADASEWSNRLHAASLIQAQLAAQAATWQSILANQSIAAANPGQLLLQNTFRDAFNHHFNAFNQQQQQQQQQLKNHQQQQQQQHHRNQQSEHCLRSNGRSPDASHLSNKLDALSPQATIGQQLHLIHQQHQAQLTQRQQAKRAKLAANATAASSSSCEPETVSASVKRVRAMDIQKRLDERERKREEALQEKKIQLEEKMKRELELKRQQEQQLAKEQEMQKRREMHLMAEVERERRRQHMQLVRAMDIQKRFEEREKRREEALQEKKLQQEKKMLKKRIDMELLKELKKPIEDMRLKNCKPLPRLNRIAGLKLPAKAFADILMTFEFLHNFGNAIGLDSDSLPSIDTLQLALLNMQESAQEETSKVLRHLLRCAIDSPGLPVNMTTVVGQKLKDVPITRLNISEVLRLYFSSFVIHRPSAARGVEGKLLKLLSQNKPFESLSPTHKAEVLAYLCNELSCHPAIVKRIEENIEQVAAIRRDKWAIDFELRKYKSIKVRREARRAQYAAQENCTESDQDKVGDYELRLKSLAEDSGESGAETDEHISPVNLDAPDEEPEMSNDELDKKIERLARQCTLITNKLNKASHGLRVDSLGQDRYRRRYWVLPASGGIFVEGIESAEPEQMGANRADETCLPCQDEDVKDTSVGGDKPSCEDQDHERESQMRGTSDAVAADTSVKSNDICETIDESAIDDKLENKSEKLSKKKKKNSQRISKRKKTKHQPEPEVFDEETEEDEKHSVAADEPVNVSVEQDEKPSIKCEESPVVVDFDKKPIFAETEEKSLEFDEAKTKCEVTRGCNGDTSGNIDTTEAQSNTANQRSQQLGVSHLVASVLLSKQQQALKSNQQQVNSVTDDEVPKVPPKAWFSILPRVPCTSKINSEQVTEDTEHVSMSHGQNESLANEMLDESKQNLDKSPLTSGKLLPKDLLNLLLNGGAENIDLNQLLSLEDLSDICPSILRRVEAQKEELYAEPMKIPLEYQHEWWRISDPAQLRSLMDCLDERATRERNLHRHLTKYHSYITTKCKSNAAEFDVTELDRNISQLCLYGAPRDSGRYSAEAALELDIAVLSEIDALEEKIAASSMQVRGWTPSKKFSEMNYNFKRKLVPFSIEDLFVRAATNGDPGDCESDETHLDDGDDDDDDERDSDFKSENHLDTLEFGRERLLNVESMIERRYLKPPLGFKANTMLIFNRNSVDEMADNAADENAPSGLLRWREAVRECRTSGQLALLTHFLESCIAWDKSIMRANCQFCASGENEAQLLLCDGCDKGYHMYCFKPKMEQVPDGDWYCFECQNKNKMDKVCVVCGKKGKLLSCEACPKVFHPNCVDPPVAKPPKGKWSCDICARKPKKYQ